jgi:DNA-binding MarR family transcriptional regulator
VDGLVQLSFLVQNTLARVAGEYELSMTQLRLLGILRDRAPGMQELAAAMALDKSSITGLIDRAERRGLVRRVNGSKDRRAVQVVLTERGREVTQLGARRVQSELNALVRGLSGVNRTRLSALASAVVLANPPEEVRASLSASA